MTREEAIQALKDLAEINVRHGCDDKWITALNMACAMIGDYITELFLAKTDLAIVYDVERREP